MGQHVSREDYEHTYTDEPHATRRREILKKHPEVKTLFGPDPMELVWISQMVFLQIASLFYVQHLGWPMLVLLAYCVGGTVNHILMMAIHESAHNLVFGIKWPAANRAVGIWANLPLGIPAAIKFKPHHLMHHRHLGEFGQDNDLPTSLETKLFCTTVGKVVWLFLQPLFYTIRPIFVHPLPISRGEVINVIVQLAYNAAIVYFFNWKCLAYMVIGTFLAMGLHPLAGHFITEHYLFVEGQETYSYYGSFNWVSFNAGYHNEHHDFPYIAGSRLPKLKAMVPEYYDNLYDHKSWIMVLYQFIMDPDIGPYARIVREKSKINEHKNVKLLHDKCEFDVNGLANANDIPNVDTNGGVANGNTNGHVISDGYSNSNSISKIHTNGAMNGNAKKVD